MTKANEHMEVMTKAQPDGLWQVMHNILATKSQKGGFHGELFAMRAPPPFTPFAPFCCAWSVQEEALDPRGKRLDTRQLANGAPSLTPRFALQTTRTATAWSRTQNSTLTLATSENQCEARQCPVVTRAIYPQYYPSTEARYGRLKRCELLVDDGFVRAHLPVGDKTPCQPHATDLSPRPAAE